MKLELKNVSKNYGRKVVLDGVSTSIGNGIYGLLGANGVGKTTLFNIISGYTSPTDGEVIFSDGDTSIGILPQKFNGYPEMTVLEFLHYIATIKGAKINRSVREDIKEKLQIFNLVDKRNSKIKKLSGGQVRRVGLAQAFLLNPSIVLLDEPTAGLDPTERNHFKNYINKLSDRETIFISTHIVSDLEFITKKIFILKDGNFIMEGSEDELINLCRGKVWETKFKDRQEMNRKLNGVTISNIYDYNGEIVVRFITDNPVLSNRFEVKPTLEDVYLYNFKNEGKNNEI